MPAGLQVFNADGSLQFDSTGRIFRILARFSSGTSNGSQSVSGVTPANAIAFISAAAIGYWPTVTVNTGSVSWTFPPEGATNVTITVMGY